MSEKQLKIDKWIPDYEQQCSVCDYSPTVTGVENNKVVYDDGMCGACVWGDADCIDPDNW